MTELAQEKTPGITPDWSSVDARDCSIAYTATVIGDRWSPLVLREIAMGVDRFDAIARHLDISRRTLTERLDALVGHGVIERIPYREPGQRLRHHYRLTVGGEALRPLLQAMGDWGSRHRPDDVGPPVSIAVCACGETAHLDVRCAAGHTAPLDARV